MLLLCNVGVGVIGLETTVAAKDSAPAADKDEFEER
jgi:hypothetical protein